jgi:hypothetical protein
MILYKPWIKPALNIPMMILWLGLKRKVAGDCRNVAEATARAFMPPSRRFHLFSPPSAASL